MLKVAEVTLTFEKQFQIDSDYPRPGKSQGTCAQET